MERSITWLPQSIRLLATIYRHIYRQTKSEKIAFNLVAQIQQSAATLLLFPQGGSFEEVLRDNPKGYRSLVTEKHYKLIYTIKDEKTIEIAAVWDCRQNPKKLQQIL